MKKLIAILGLLALAASAEAQEVYQRKYATATTVNFALWKIDGTALQKAATLSSDDVTLIKDEGTEAASSTPAAPVDEGSSYSLALTATDMTAARIVVHISDTTSPQSYLDKVLVVETYGQNESAQHPDATIALAQSATGTTIVLAAAENYADDLLNNNSSVVILSGTGAGQVRCITDYDQSDDTATVAAWTTTPDNTSRYTIIETPNCNASFSGTVTSVSTGAITSDSFASGAITATAIATDAITSAEIADNAIDAGAIAASAITSSEFAQSAADLVWSTSARALTDKADFSASCTLGTDAITAASVSAAAGSKLADIVWRRTSANIEASSYGDTLARKSGYGVIAQQTHKTTIVGDTMTNYKSDGTTTLDTRTVTSSSSAAPITGLSN
jgi:hypothetical protein